VLRLSDVLKMLNPWGTLSMLCVYVCIVMCVCICVLYACISRLYIGPTKSM
jgi:hypothetical protein